jgi:hypothetical protein
LAWLEGRPQEQPKTGFSTKQKSQFPLYRLLLLLSLAFVPSAKQACLARQA